MALTHALAVVGALGAAVCYGVATILQAVAARRSRAGEVLDPRLLLRLVRQGPYVAGLALDAVGFFASVAALRALPLFFVEAAIASSVGITAVLAVVALGASLRRREVVALAGLGLGLLLLALAARPEAARPLARPAAWGVLAGVPVVLAVGVAAGRARPAKAAAGLAVAAGLGFAGVGVAARALRLPDPWWHLAEQPLAWALAGYGLLATLLFASALQRGAVTTAAALSFAVETVVPAAVGLVLLGDRARPGLAAAAWAGFVLTLAGALVLARYAEPPPVSLTPSSRARQAPRR